MRKLFYLLFFTCLFIQVNAQTNLLENGNFENWNAGSTFPTGWGTRYSPTETLSAYKKIQTNVRSGSNALGIVHQPNTVTRFDSPEMNLEAGTYVLSNFLRGRAILTEIFLLKRGGSTSDSEAVIKAVEASRFSFSYYQPDWTELKFTFVIPQAKAGYYAIFYRVQKTADPGNFVLDSVTFCKQVTEPVTNPWQSKLLSMGVDGSLTYHQDEYGYTLPDFGAAGYRGGGIPIPDVPVKKEISPISGDNTQHIQDAINEMGLLPLDANGIRGALLLKAGKYEIATKISMPFDGVVLRGEGSGDNPATSTILYATGTSQRRLITVGGNSDNTWGKSITNKTNITDNIVVAGSKSFHVESVSGYSVGDQIAIRHPKTQAWFDAISGGVGSSGAGPWTMDDDLDIVYNRYITAINSSTKEISIDAPVYYSLQKSLTQCYIHKFSIAGIVKEVGVENLRLDTYYDNRDTTTTRFGTYKPDEAHATEALALSNTENSWMRNVVATHFSMNTFNFRWTTRCTVEECKAIDPVSIIDGSRRYNFNFHFGSQQILLKNCYANYGRHHYVSNGTTSVSGIVMKDCTAEYAYAVTEGHRRWTSGLLFDNFTNNHVHSGAGDFGIGFYNRGSYGTSHGWTAVHSVLWNCELSNSNAGGKAVIQKPPTAQNYGIGNKAAIVNEAGPFGGCFPGYIEGTNQPGLQPSSLYDAQLAERLKNFSSDTSLKMIYMGVKQSVGGTNYNPPKLRGFSSDVYEYNYTLSIEQKISPDITVETNDTKARAYITPAKDVTGSKKDRTITIQVVAENGSTQEYKVILTQYKGYINGIPVEASNNKGGFAQASGIYTRDSNSNHGDFYSDWGIRPHSSTETYVVTPKLDNGAGTFRIWVKRYQNDGKSSTLCIQTATESEPNWVTRYSIPSSELESGWKMKTCELNIEDPTVQVKIWIDRPAETTRAMNFYFDDIKITPFGGDTKLPEFKNDETFHLSTSGRFIVLQSTEDIPYAVYGISGQLIVAGQLTGGRKNIFVSPGLYLVHCKNVTKKVFIK